MTTILLGVGACLAFLLVLVLWAACRAGARADDQSDRTWREH